MSQFRWVSKAIAGQWLSTRGEAMCDALAWGQAAINRGPGAIIVLKGFAKIQQRALPQAEQDSIARDLEPALPQRWAA